MAIVVDTINSIMGVIIGTICAPFSSFAPWISLAVISAISGVILVYLYGLVSPQQRIKKLKTKIFAEMLEAILFRHDIFLSLRAQGRMFISGLHYFVIVLPALVIMLVPCLLILTQLNARFGYQGIKPGESILLKAQLKPGSSVDEIDATLQGGALLDGPVRVKRDGELVWRIKGGEESGTNLTSEKLVLTPKKGATPPVEVPLYTEHLRSATAVVERLTSSFFEGILYPAAPVLKNSVVESLQIFYPEKRYLFLGFKLHWVLIFFIISMVSGVIGSKLFKITI